MFPDNFAKEIKRETESKPDNLPIKEERHGNVASLVQPISTYGFPARGVQPQMQTKNIKKETKKQQCKVLSGHTPQNDNNLKLKVGYIIDINEEVEEDWRNGTLNNKLGLFPSNFVKVLAVRDHGETHEAQEDSETVLSPPYLSLLWGMGMKRHLDQLHSQRKLEELDLETFLKKASLKLRTRLSNERET